MWIAVAAELNALIISGFLKSGDEIYVAGFKENAGVQGFTVCA